MSDSFISLVPAKENWENPAEKAQEIINWLIDLEVILPTQTDCVLGDEKGFPPHSHCHKILQHTKDDLFFDLKTNGLEVITERHLFMNWSGYDRMECPNCGNDAMEAEDEWQDAVGKWLEGENPEVECPVCHESAPPGYYRMYDDDYLSCALSNLGFTFWNWSEFTATFLQDFEVRLGASLKVIYGRL